jgi:SagB-type dehydrogenase family enzyme
VYPELASDAPALGQPQMSNGPLADAGYFAEIQRGQRLLTAGQFETASELFSALLDRLGDDPSRQRAEVLGRLARCHTMSGRSGVAIARLQEALKVAAGLGPDEGALLGALLSELGEVLRTTARHDEARQAFVSALQIAEELQDPRAQAVDLSRLGALAVAEGKSEEALRHYEASLALMRGIREPAMQAAVLHQMGTVLQEQHHWKEAERQYLEAARIWEQEDNLAAAAQSWNQLAALNVQAGRPEAAEALYRKAIDLNQRIGNRLQLGSHLGNLALLLVEQPGRLDEARQLAEAAVTIHRTLDPAAAQVWRNYGVLAGILAKEAETAADDRRKAELQTQARHCRELCQFAPRFLGALARLSDEPGFARAVILGRLARCFYMSGRGDLAIARLHEALNVTATLAPGEDLSAMRRALLSELGEMLMAANRHQEARQTLLAALQLAEELRDLRAQAEDLSRLGALDAREGKPEEAARHYEQALALAQRMREAAMETAMLDQLARCGRHPPSARAAEPEDTGGAFFQILLDEELITDYGLEGDLLVDGPRQRRIARWTGEPCALADDVHAAWVPGVRTAADDGGAVRFYLPLGEPVFERHRGSTVMRRLRREVAVSGNSALLWRLIAAVDGTRRLVDVLSELPPHDGAAAGALLGALAAVGAVDVSGRPIGRYLHSTTKKGVLPAGGLEGDEVLQLVTDGDYKVYSGASRIGLTESVPERLRDFYELTRARRSRRDYDGQPVSRADFDALLQTACGVTGTMAWGARQVKLRAYPASGALYAVEIYPVVLAVELLAAGVYHYRPIDGALEVVRDEINGALFLDAIQPAEREMVAGAAVMICLTGRFPRHERKYGEGGYRMLVAEAGHISQNLILAATALGLSARPFGGVFDDLLNADLGLDRDSEQFLLAVLVGHAGGADER